MRLAELSRRSAVSIASIKYYVRSGLLPSGERVTATEVDYGEHHLHRLRLIRALIDIRRLPVSVTKEIVGAITAAQDDPGQALVKVLDSGSAFVERKSAQGTVTPAKRDANGFTDARSLIEEMGWCVPATAPAVRELGGVLEALSALGVDIEWQTLLPYAQLADDISALDSRQIHGAAGASPQAERAAVVAVLLEPAILALRRLALEDKSSRRNKEASRTPR
ncbi:MerR family transcriptional regulator [Streptomyces sp. NPDC050485]|uniref:MerR family transcriptional regulator n=1 Tax=Streptomyces sp. NPDC050485 TaxID=3365617 RepID=UPI0037AF4282